MKAFWIGAAVGTAVALLFANQKRKQLEHQGLLLTHSLTEGGSALEQYLTTQGTQVRDEIAAVGARAAETLARRTGVAMLDREYGFNDDFAEQLRRIELRVNAIDAAVSTLRF